MPILGSNLGSSTPGNLSPGAPTTLTQLNLRQMVGEVLSWNPDLDPQQAVRFVQNSYRRVLDHKLWKATEVQGVLSAVGPTNQGTVAVSNGSLIVTGTGTNWTTALIGQQFRIGFAFPAYNIVNVDVTNQLLFLQLPWADVSRSNTAYIIVQMIYTLGPGLKYLDSMVNCLMGFPLRIFHGRVQLLNAIDTWRAQVAWTHTAVAWPPSPDGNLRVELYPAPFQIQSFAYTAYAQPADLVNDTDIPLPWVRADLIALPAIAEAIDAARPDSPYFKPNVAAQKRKLFQVELLKADEMDENAQPRRLTWDYTASGEGGEYTDNTIMREAMPWYREP